MNSKTPALLALENEGKHREDILVAMNEVGACKLGTELEKSLTSIHDNSADSLNSTIDDLIENMIIPNSDTSTKPLRVLCLDGGGIRGIILTKIVQAIQVEAEKPAHELFDWISGTSTGALFACALVTNRSPETCQRIYFRLKDEVFKGTRPYDHQVFEDFLRAELGELKMTDITAHKLLLTSTISDRHPGDLFLFKSYDDEGKNPLDLQKDAKTGKHFEPVPKMKDTPMWEGCRASAVAPTYFRPRGRFIDGALVANNPTLDTIMEIERYNRELAKTGRENEIRPILNFPRTSIVFDTNIYFFFEIFLLEQLYQ